MMLRSLCLIFVCAVTLPVSAKVGDGVSSITAVQAGRGPASDTVPIDPSVYVDDSDRGPQATRFAKVEVRAPGELLLGKVLHAQVSVTLAEAAAVLEVAARTEGSGVGLPLTRKWRFVQVKPGQASVFKLPYQLTKAFKRGAVHLDISTRESQVKGKEPAYSQTATLRLRR